MIKTITKISLAIVACLILSPNKALGSHMMGADMSYVCLGNGKYHITAKVYRDCRGISFSGPSTGVFAGTNGGNGCGSYTNSMTRTGIRDVTPRCSTASKPCSPTNTGGTGEGIEEHTYELTIDFNASPYSNFVNKSSCCEVTFYIGQCCRNGAITTGPSGNNFYTTCMINICNLKKTKNKCNTSPQLSNEPIGFLCCNEAYYFNNGALDTADFDSFSYALVPGISTLPSTGVTYASPFSYQYPMTPYCVPPTTIKCTPNTKTNPPRGFLMDTSTGDLIFTPTKCDEVGIVVIEITEWRADSATGKYLMVGKTRRDMQLIVKDDCGYNKAPTIEGPTVNKVCEGDKICFKIYGKDETFTPYQTVPDTVTLTWNKGIPGATFTITDPKAREKEAEFCWSTKVGQASDIAYSFTVKATDDHCPKPSQSIRGFKVKVNPRAFSERKYTILKCGRFAFEAKLPQGFKGTPSYKWSFRDSTGSNEFYYSVKKTDTMTFYKGGKFIVVHTVNNSDNCPTIYRDTIIIPDPPTVVIATKDTFACLYTTMSLNALVLYGKYPYSYKWTRPITHISGDTFANITIPNIIRDSTMIVQVKDGDGCIFYDTATIFLKPLPAKPNIPDQRICTYQTATFDALHNDTMKYLWSTGDTTRYMTHNVKGLYNVRIMDPVFKCIMRDTVLLNVNDTVVSLAGSDKKICTNDTISLWAHHRNPNLAATYRWRDLQSGGTISNNNTANVKPLNSNGHGNPAMKYYYELYTTVSQGGLVCEHKDTMAITVNSLPRVSWIKVPLDAQCHNYGDIKLNNKVDWPKTNLRGANNFKIWGVLTKYSPIGLVDSGYTGSEPVFNFWTTKIDNEKDLATTYVEETLTVWFKDTNGCVNTAKTKQRINGNPVIQLQHKTYCQDLGSAPMSNSVIRPKASFGTVQTWQALQVPAGVNPANVLEDQGSNVWIFKFGSVTEDFYAGTYTMKFCVTDQVTGCFQCDTTDIEVITEPKVTPTTPNPVCVNWDTMDLRNYIKLNGGVPDMTNPLNKFSIVEFRYDRSDPKVTSTKLVDGYKFHPGFGAGAWQIKFSSLETGCLKEDSFYIYVNDTPDAVLLTPITICSADPKLDMNTRVDWAKTKPSGQVGQWIGPKLGAGNLFDPTSTSIYATDGPYKMRFDYTDNNGCTDTEFYYVTIRRQPEIQITTGKPAQGCENAPYTLRSTHKYDSAGIVWATIQGSDGSINNNAIDSINYIHGAGDKTNGYAWLKVSTKALPADVCPTVADSIQIVLHPYPDPEMASPVSGCRPLIADFTSTEKRGIPAGQLSYVWDFGNGDTSYVANPTGVLFNTQGIYNFTLTVTNTAGPCPTTITGAAMAQAYPTPAAAFTTDPPYKTTIALPKFRTFNKTNLDKSVFPSNNVSYWWDFADPAMDPNDTSTLENPRWAYGKDTNTYRIMLIATAALGGCKDTAWQWVHVGPDIIVFIPDVFTPDQAGPNRNNTFMITAQNYKDMRMMIFNRWGERVYETDDIDKGWDGKANGQNCQQDVYVYKVDIHSKEGKLYQFNGTVTLLR